MFKSKKNPPKYLPLLLCAFLIVACGQQQEEVSSLIGINNGGYCIEKFWPKKDESFTGVKKANDLFGCMGNQLDNLLQGQGYKLDVVFLDSSLSFANRESISKDLYARAIIKPCYTQQLYNPQSSSGARGFLFDTMVDCIVYATYKHWEYGILMLHVTIVGKNRISILPLTIDMAKPCMLDYHAQISETENSIYRLKSLQECLIQAILDPTLFEKDNYTEKSPPKTDNTRLIEEEQEVIETEVINPQDEEGFLPPEDENHHIKKDSLTIDKITTCIEQYNEDQGDQEQKTRNLIECTADAIYEQASWNANLKANFIVLSDKKINNRLEMEFDMVIPVWTSKDNQQSISLQPEILFSIYSSQDPSWQSGAGVIYRLAIMDGIVGFNIFHDVRIFKEQEQYRLSVGADYQSGGDFYSINYYPPLSEWINIGNNYNSGKFSGLDMGLTKAIS
ncbi:MAG: inverse autotransporter beta domain-containing protein, partial [Halobacteriovoraceae bacterium]|nr:inverse autotransporter beta domain-containing protein [Halobacteriovoraceae bacterium]